jgi:hypothetical protein
MRGSPAPAAQYDALPLMSWLDPSVVGKVVSVTAEADQGKVIVGGIVPSDLSHTPSVTFSYDPRLPDGRVAAGHRTIKITWHVDANGKTADLTGTVEIDVSDDGVLRTVGNQGRIDADPLPMGIRFALGIDAGREGPGWRLAARLPAGLDAESFAWRATAGTLDGDGAEVRFTPPPAGGYQVTCVVRASANALGIGSFGKA